MVHKIYSEIAKVAKEKQWTIEQLKDFLEKNKNTHPDIIIRRLRNG